MTDHRSSAEIEREIEQERAGLTRTLEDIQDRFSLDGVVRQLSDQFREHGGDIGASVSRSVRDNPMALALTGVGLAWMIFGNPRESRNRTDLDDRRYSGVDQDYPSRTRTVRDQGAYASQAAAMRHGQTYGGTNRREVPGWVRSLENSDDHARDADSGRDMSDRARDARDRVAQGASHMKDSASRAADRTGEGARGVGSSVSQGVSDMGRSVSDAAAAVGEKGRGAASYTAERAAAIRARLAEGTESLGEEARARVIAARERALDARSAAISYGRQGREKAVDLFEEQPLIAGALALAVGAAIGAALPRTRLEDEYMGEESDHLIHEAERIFAEERAKAGQVVKAAVNEAEKVAQEAAEDAKELADKAKSDADNAAPGNRTAADAVADRAKSAGERIAGAAKDEADRQDLAKPKT